MQGACMPVDGSKTKKCHKKSGDERLEKIRPAITRRRDSAIQHDVLELNIPAHPIASFLLFYFLVLLRFFFPSEHTTQPLFQATVTTKE